MRSDYMYFWLMKKTILSRLSNAPNDQPAEQLSDGKSQCIDVGLFTVSDDADGRFGPKSKPLIKLCYLFHN